MLAVVLLAAGCCAVCLATGLVARSRLASGDRLVAQPHAVPCFRGALRSRWRAMISLLAWPERTVLGLAVLLMLTDTALALAAPLPLMVVADHGLSHHPYPGWLAGLAGMPAVPLAMAAALAGLLLQAAGATAGYLVTFLMGAASERMAWRLRTGVVSHLLHAVPRQVSSYPLGELTSRVGTDTVAVAGTVAGIIETAIPDAAVLAGMAAVTAALDWRLTLVVLGVVPLYVLTARLRNRAVTGASQRSRARSGELAALAAGLLARIPAVHVFGQAGEEAASYSRASARAASAAVAALDAGARFTPVTDTLPGLGLAGALVAGTAEVTAGRLTIGGLLVLLAYLSSLTGPVRSLTRLSASVARGTASRDRIIELLSLPLAERPARAAPRVRVAGTGPWLAPPGNGLAVTLADVSYAHRPGQPVLSGTSMHVRAGELVCITGPSGAGKSTLLSLLVRLADPQSGVIRIGGLEIGEVPLAALRRLVTLVPQDPWLHAGTIASNIAYGLPGASWAGILEAAQRAGVDSFAAGLPDGYGTQVGEGGRQLSGGQQRRVAIARALLRDAPVLLLDEPTAGLDPAAESRLVRGLIASTRGRTVILVTHQPGLVALADRVFRLSEGTLEPVAARPLPHAASARLRPVHLPARPHQAPGAW